jgi:methionine-S-sulfoxide reductase
MGIRKAYFAAGCFWGVEYHFQQYKGVLSAISGYMGGVTPNPSYKEVCTGLTGHLEVVKVEYDEMVVGFEELCKLFFEMHDFTQENGQGPDIGSQYLSAVFYNNEEEKNCVKTLIVQLEEKGYKVATLIISAHNTPFFEAEEYHQDYYFKHNKTPYCHSLRKIF